MILQIKRKVIILTNNHLTINKKTYKNSKNTIGNQFNTFIYYPLQLYDFYVFGILWWFPNIWKIKGSARILLSAYNSRPPQNNPILIKQQETLHYLIEASKNEKIWIEFQTQIKNRQKNTWKWLIGKEHQQSAQMTTNDLQATLQDLLDNNYEPTT